MYRGVVTENLTELTKFLTCEVLSLKVKRPQLLHSYNSLYFNLLKRYYLISTLNYWFI